MSSLSSPGPQGFQEPEPQGSSSPLSEIDLYGLTENAELTGDIQSHLDQGQIGEAESLVDQQLENAILNDLAIELGGGDPSQQEPLGIGRALHPETAIVQELLRQEIKLGRKNQVLTNGGWGEVKGFAQGIINQWKAEREKPTITLPVGPGGAEMELPVSQQPLEADPNVLAEMRNRAAKIDADLKAAGFPEGVWNDPELARVVAPFLHQYGMVAEGEQEYRPAYKDAPIGFREIGWLGTEVVGPGVGAIAELGFNFGYGVAQLGAMAYEGLSGQNVEHTLPTVVVKDDNGNVVHNGGKLPTGMELIAGAQAWAIGEDVDNYMTQAGLSEQYAALRREGLDAVVAPVSRFVGSVAGFIQPGGWAMAGGQQLLKGGLSTLVGAERLTRLPGWAKKMTNMLAIVGGAAGGNAALMATTYGHHEGYAHAAIDGAVVTPVILGLGAMGRNLEKFLHRAKMPKPVARAISGAMEGAGFGTYTIATEDEVFHGERELWSFLKDPNEETLGRWSDVMVENVLGMMVFKTVFGVTPGQYALDRMRGKITEGRVRERQVETEAVRFAEAERTAKVKAEAAPSEPTEEARPIKPSPTEAPAEPTKLPSETPLQEGRQLSFKESGPGRQEWQVRDPEGRLIAGGSFTVEGQKARIWSAEVREEFRGKGIYPEVLRELARRFPEGIESIDQTPEAQAAWKKAFGGVSRETFERLGREIVAERRGEAPLGAAEPARQQARMEAAGRFETAEGARERLYETVSARGEYPAHGAAPTPEGVPGTEPIAARDVMAEGQVGPIAPAVRRKGMGPAKRYARGYYSTREDLIRMEGSRDLNNYAHEWGHALWQHRGADMGLSPRAANELLEVGRPTSTPRMSRAMKMHEGMAEFMARHLLGDAELPTKYPTLWREVMDYFSRGENADLLGQVQRLEGAFQRWRDQGMLEQARQMVVRDDDPITLQQAQLVLGRPVKKMTPLVRLRVAGRRAVDAFETAMIDDLAMVRKIQGRVLKAAGVDPESLPITANPIRMLDATRGKSGAVTETFLFRHAMGFMGQGGPRGPSLRQALKEINTNEVRDFDTYLVARRSLEALDKGLEVPLTREHWLTVVDRLGNPRFERAAQELKHWFDDVITYATEAGALTEDAARAIKGSWSVYVPFFRALAGPKRARGRGVAERGSGVQRMKKGEQLEIRDPLETALEVAQSIIQKAHQAAAMKAFYTLHVTTGRVGEIVTEVPRDVKAATITARQLAEALERANLPGDVQHIAETFADALVGMPAADAEGIVTLFSQQTRPSGSRPIVAFVPRYTEAEIARFQPRVQEQLRAANGKLKWLEFNADIYNAVMDTDPGFGAMHPILRALSVGPTTIVKLGATTINPDFIGRNILRDAVLNTLFTDVKSKSRFVPIFGAASNFAAGMVQQYGTERGGADLFRDIGGMQSTLIGRELLGVLPSRQAIDPSLPSEALRKVIGAFQSPEATLRIREFNAIRKRALDQGKTELEANLEALEAGQEISTNFIRGGTVARAINLWVPYFNAGIQGNRKLLRHLLGYEGGAKQKQAIAQGLYNISMTSALLWLLHRGEDWYQDLPEWRRMNYWTFRVPFTDELVSVPKPFEAGKIFGTIPELILSQADDRPLEMSAVGVDLLKGFVNGFDFMPALFGPSIETSANYSFWRGREIVPDWMEEGRVPEDQFTSYTTGVARLIGKWFNISPAKAEYWISGQTGGMGLSLMRAVDTLTGNTPTARGPGVAAEDIPFVGTFLRQRPHRMGAYVQDVFDLHRELNQLAGSDQMTPVQAGMRPAVRRAKETIANIKKAARAGRISEDEANRRAYQIARPVIEAYERATAR